MDLRLVLPAGATWGSAAWLVGGGPGPALAVALTAVVLAGATAGRRRALALAAVCVAAVAASCAWRLTDVASSPLAEAAHGRVVVTLEAEVDRDARVFARFGQEASVVGLRVLRAQVDGRVVATRDRVTAFLDDPGDGLVVGRRVVVTGRLAPSEQTREAATVDVLERTAPRGAAWWWEASERVREGVRRSVAHTGQGPSALVPALVDGDDAALTVEVREEFRRSGLTHLLAVSGTNLTIVLAVVLVLARAARAPTRVLVVLGLLAVAGFVLLARPDPSVLRAAGMGVVGLAALGYGGRGGLRALCAAVVALLFLDPWLSRSLGFVLSVCATAGILVLAPPMTARLRAWLPHWCALAIAVPLAAQVACTPALAAISGEISLVAVLANVLAGPVVAPATVAGLAGGFLDLVAAPVGRSAGTVAGACAAWILAVGHHTAALAGASVPWGAPWWVLLIVLPALVAVLWVALRRPVLVVGLVLGLAVAMWRPPQAGWPPPGWVMVACDVGQGDATVVSPGDGTAVLVDVGQDPVAVDRCLRRLRVDHLRAVVLTHDHADHVAGWSGAVTGRRVDAVLVGPTGGAPPGTAGVRTAAAGDTWRWGQAAMAVLWPAGREPLAAGEGESAAANDASLVVRADVAGVTVLLTGDVEPPGQEAILRSGVDVRADVLKMPHHGSSRQSERFFAAVGARVATISVGADNDHGHPAAATLELLRGQGTAWWRTDTDGDVAVVRTPDGPAVVHQR